MNTGFPSVYLDADRCNGCTRCTQRCPTEAIRVRDGKAHIMQERCVTCGECIRVCPAHAMKGNADRLDEVLRQHKYNVALPAPSLYGQFAELHTRTPILEGLKRIGFDDTFEVAAAAEVVSANLHFELQYGSIPHPIITTACPVILRLVRIRFPSLLPHLFNYRSPTEVAGRWARRLAAKKTGLAPEDIGCILISPCPAKYASNKGPLFIPDSSLSGVVSMEEVVPRLLPVIGSIEDKEKYAQSSAIGVKWATSGGQAEAVQCPNHLAAAGMENIIHILEALEDGKLSDMDLIELDACYPGCVGGSMTVENPFIANARIRDIMQNIGPVLPSDECPIGDMRWERTPSPNPVMQLDDDIGLAMEKLEQIRALSEELPGVDCGACGAPSCRAYAEDVVSGRVPAGRCVLSAKEDSGSRK